MAMNSALMGWNMQETRWRFVIGAVLLSLTAVGSVLTYPMIMELLPQVTTMNLDSRLGQEVARAIEASGTFRGYLWWNLIRQNLLQAVVLFAALLGVGAQFFPGAGRSTLFILSLPVSRRQLFLSRILVGLVELLLLVFVPVLLVSFAAPVIGERFPLIDTLVYGWSLYVVGAVFYALAALCSTSFDDPWRPLLITCGTAIVLSLVSVLTGLPSLFEVMSANRYFESGELPWAGWLVAIGLAVVLLFGGAMNFERQEF